MEESFKFILHRFYYGLASGIITNAFIMGNYFVFVHSSLLPQKLEYLKNINMTESMAVMIFITFAVIIGAVTEGVNEAGSQYYMSLKENEKINIWGKIKKSLFWHIFGKVSVEEACEFYSEQVKKESKDGKTSEKSIYEFLNESDSDGPVSAMNKWAIVFKKRKVVNRYKDLSFIFQFTRLSFICIAIISFFALIGFTVLYFIKGDKGLNFIVWFYLFSFIVSELFAITTTPMASQLGRRYIRSIGRAYKAREKKESTNSA